MMDIDRHIIISLVMLALLTAESGARNPDVSADSISVAQFEDSIRHWNNVPRRRFAYERYEQHQHREIADNLLHFQNPDGGWPKNVDWLGKLDRATVFSLLSESEKRSTFDNRNTYPQIEYLSKVFTETGEEKYSAAAERGLNFVIASQNPSGGWHGSDVDAITFNDDVMTGVMHLLLDIMEGKDYFAWIPPNMKPALRDALDRGIDVTLRCQIVVDGVKTGWCQQHDHRTLEPIKARRYELPSITSMETTGIVEFLMRLDPSRPGVASAIHAAVAWLEKSALTGIRLERHPVVVSEEGEEIEERADVVAVADPGAPPVWARYYEVDTNRPFFANRDGIKVYSLAEVAQERRIGYAWYGYWPEKILREDYPQWLESLKERLQE